MGPRGSVDSENSMASLKFGEQWASVCCARGSELALSQGRVHRLKVHLNLSSIDALGFPGGLAGKESACNAGHWGSILGQEGPLEKGTAAHSSISAWKSLTRRRSLVGYSPWGLRESDTIDALAYFDETVLTNSGPDYRGSSLI